MAIQIYENSISPNARRVRMLAIELQLDLEWHTVDLQKGEHKAPPNLARNANGKVPTLVDGDFMLWESNAIIQYLADSAPNGAAIYPKDPKQRAEIHRWQFWTVAHLSPATAMLTYERFMKKVIEKKDPEPALVAWADSNFKRFSAVLEQNLATREWVAGKTLTLADLAVAPVFGFRNQAGIDLAPLPHVSAWLARIEARPSWQQTKPPF